MPPKQHNSPKTDIIDTEMNEIPDKELKNLTVKMINEAKGKNQ